MKAIDLTELRGEYEDEVVDAIEEKLDAIDRALRAAIGTATETLRTIRCSS